MWLTFLEAEAQMNIECEEVSAEANDIKAGWGSSIFAEANRLLAMQKAQVDAQVKAELKRKAEIREVARVKRIASYKTEETQAVTEKTK
jgi:hypothetical protein